MIGTWPACSDCTNRGPTGCHGDCTGTDETPPAEVILIDGLYTTPVMMDVEVAVEHKGKALVGRYHTPAAPIDPWMQRRREPWRRRRR